MCSLPKGWEVKKLGDVCDIALGKTPTRSNKKFWDIEKETNNIWLSIRDLSNTQGKEIFDSREYISNSGAKLGNLVKKGTLLASFKLTLGRLAFAGTELYTNEAIASLEIKDNGLDNGYLYHYLTFFDWDAETKGDVKIKGKTLNKAKLKEIKTLIPPLPEQKRIVAILEKAFTAIDQAKANTEKNLKNARELFQSKLQETFDNGKLKIDTGEWEEKKLNEIGIAQTGTTPKTSDKNNYGDFIPFVKPADIDFEGDGKIKYDNVGLSKQGLKTGRKMSRGSILMVCIGASIGKVGFSDRDVSCNQQINSITTKEKFNSKFVYYALSIADFLKQVILNSAQATLPIINKGKWENLTVYYPKSLAEQKDIVKKLDVVSTETKKLEAIYQRKITCLDELKKSILQKAFNGEL